MKLVRQTKVQVKAYVRKNGKWNGYMVGSKVSEYHIARGWCLGFRILLGLHETRGVVDAENDVCENVPLPGNPHNYDFVPRTFAALIDNWSYYNSCSETGYYPIFYHIVK